LHNFRSANEILVDRVKKKQERLLDKKIIVDSSQRDQSTQDDSLTNQALYSNESLVEIEGGASETYLIICQGWPN
jgi:hypothetical protein